MIVAIQGTKSFNDYNIFLRGLGTVLRSLPEDDKEFIIHSVGPTQINSFALGFANITEDSLKAKGIKIRFKKVPLGWLEDHVHTVDYVLYFSKPKEALSSLVKKAEAKDIEVGVYRY